MNAHDPARCLRYGKPSRQRVSTHPHPLARCIRRGEGGAQ